MKANEAPEQYISKSALVAEIERRIKTIKDCMLDLRILDYYQGKVDALNDTISFIDTLEVKEVDLNEEISNYLGDDWRKDADGEIENEMIAFAKHFFELVMQEVIKHRKEKRYERQSTEN